MRTSLLLALLMLFFFTGKAQQITLDTSLTSDEQGVIEEYWYWSGGFPVIGEDFEPNADITVYATDPNGIPWRDFTGTSDGSGNFSVQISAKKIRSVLGEHTVTATDGTNTVTATLTVIANENEVLNTTTTPDLLTQTAFNTSGILLESMGIEPNAEVKINIQSPNASGSEVDNLTPKFADGSGEFEMNINAFTPSFPWGPYMPEVPGVWTLTVHDWSGNSHYGTTTFRVLPDNPSQENYCTIEQVPSTTGQNLVYPITSFEIVGVNSNTSSASSQVYYENFTDTSFELSAGSTYTVRLKGKNFSSFAADTYTLFIDWNRNGILDEDNEVIQEGFIFNSTGEDDKVTEFQMTVPENALNGDTRLRILKVQSATTYSMFWPTGACGAYTSRGQVEDYTVNIEGGMVLPDCELTCPEDITVQAENDAETATVEYELTFDCESVSGTCEIEYTAFNTLTDIENSNHQVSGNWQVANEFNVEEGETLMVNQFIPTLLNNIITATIYFYEDNDGAPGELITSYPDLTPSSVEEIAVVFPGVLDWPVNEVTFDLPASLELTEGRYWVAINAVQAVSGYLGTVNWGTNTIIPPGGIRAKRSNNGGTSWTNAQQNADGIFKLGYECKQDPTEDTEIVLVEGLESGSEFPVGTTTVTHNLVYEGYVIDTCSFDVIVEPTAPEDCTITCPEDITVTAEPGEETVPVEYEIGYECTAGEAQAELVLAEGLASGAQFPVGTTTVTYNLVYEGETLDTCSFDVTVEENLCAVVCPGDITVETEPGETTAVVEYEISFECDGASEGVELVLAEGLASGSEFPVGTTTVTYNLVYEGETLDTCSFDVTVEEYMGVNDLNSSQLSVYPNPVKDFLNISYDKEISNVSVYDLSGKQVYTQSIHNKSAKLNLSHLSPGVYVVKAGTKEELKTFKIVKK